jgi:hypothetical protein
MWAFTRDHKCTFRYAAVTGDSFNTTTRTVTVNAGASSSPQEPRIRIVLLAVMTVGALALRSTDHLTVTLTTIKTALLIQVGCGLHIILDQMKLISAKISNIYTPLFFITTASAFYHHNSTIQIRRIIKDISSSGLSTILVSVANPASTFQGDD